MKRVYLGILILAILLGLVAVGCKANIINAFEGSTPTSSATATPSAPRSEMPWLGVLLRDASKVKEHGQTPAVAKGAVVVRVIADSPAAKAGLEKGDVLTVINGQAIATAREAVDKLSALHVGDKVSLKVMRDGQEKTVEATLGARPKGERRFIPPSSVLPERLLFGELKGIAPGERFDHFLGGQFALTNKEGKRIEVRIIPGRATAVSSNSITIDPNDKSVSGGPYEVTEKTIVRAGPRTVRIDALKSGDRVIIVTIESPTHAAAVIDVEGFGKHVFPHRSWFRMREKGGWSDFISSPTS
ncbi:MAG: PDZ domain-containing protein [Chloroflexi bacterium]|nr:PDZ domain-containing protein [Chloroflexota bacterium]MCL5074688.1 PDZ domain-containing protein [Chloroflexota bacterium]